MTTLPARTIARRRLCRIFGFVIGHAHQQVRENAQAGTALPVLQELGGWQVLEMVLKYAHLAGDHLAPYVDRMPGLRLVKDGVFGYSTK